MNPIRLLLIDDEPPARQRLRGMLARLPNASSFEVIGEAADGETGLAAVAELRPDVLFLDVQMPGLDGFGVVRVMSQDAALIDALGGALPVIIFATAFDQHAVRAFDVHAVDYLVKPFDADRLSRALARAGDRLAAQRHAPATGGTSDASLPAGLLELLGSLQATRTYQSRFAVRVGDRVYWVRAEEIDWVVAEGNYLRLYTGMGTPKVRSHLIRKTLGVLADELNPASFARIHRSALVNIDRIKELRTLSDGEYQVVLLDSTQLKLSRMYRDRLPDF